MPLGPCIAVTMEVPPETAYVELGVVMNGAGKMWVDTQDVTLEAAEPK